MKNLDYFLETDRWHQFQSSLHATEGSRDHMISYLSYLITIVIFRIISPMIPCLEKQAHFLCLANCQLVTHDLCEKFMPIIFKMV